MYSQTGLGGGAYNKQATSHFMGVNTTRYFYQHRKIDSAVSSFFDDTAVYRQSGDTTQYAATTRQALKLADLPDELLLQIAGFLRPDFPWMEKEERFDGRERTMWVTDIADLVHLSKTCRKLRPVAQEALVHTAVLGGFDGTESIMSLVRLLLARPRLGFSVRRLRVGLPPRETLYFASEKAAEELIWSSKPLGPLPSGLLAKVEDIINEMPVSEEIKQLWKFELTVSYARPLCGVLLALVPNLEYLSLSHSLGGASPNRVLRQMFGVCKDDMEADFSALPALAKLHYLNNATPANQRPLSSLTLGTRLN